MFSQSVSQTAQAVAAIPFTPASPQAAPPPEKKDPSVIDNLLSELTAVLTAGVQNQDSSGGNAILAYLAGKASAADQALLPPRLIDLLETVLNQASQADKAEEFKALLSEFVALQWAISTLDELIRQQQAADQSGASAALAEKMQARAFLKQMEAAIVGRMETQTWYSNWQELYAETFASLAQTPAQSDLAAQLAGADAITTVETLLQAAPRPDLSALAA